MADDKRLELRVGNSAVLKNGIVKGDANGCPRANLIRALEGQPKVTDRRSLATFAVGTALETVAFSWIKEELGDSVKSDVAMEEEIIDGVWLVGHCDFLQKKEDGSFKVFEHKSCSSVNVVEKVFGGHHYKPQNLAQLAHYMVIAESVEGELIYTSAIYAKKSETKSNPGWSVKAGDQETFVVAIDDKGIILVNGEPAPFDVADLLHWRNYQAELLANRRLDAPPEDWEQVPWTACSGCVYKEVCEQYDEDKNDKQFWEGIRKLIEKIGKR